MASIIEKIKDRRMREWYEANRKPEFLDEIAEEALREDYKFDSKSGLFLKNISDSGYTHINIIMPRISDIHFHPDVTETSRVLDGNGVYYYNPPATPDNAPLKNRLVRKRSRITTLVNSAHAWVPGAKGYLELDLTCDGVLDLKEEVCLVPFYEVESWLRTTKALRQEGSK